MNITKSKTFKAIAIFGLKRGYDNELISIDEFNMKLRLAQKKVFEEMDLKLSAKVTPCSIIFSGQDEPSVDISFIQYPKFPYKESALKKGILRLTTILMRSLDQNRVVIIFDDHTYMLEDDKSKLDPGISFEN